MNEVNLPKAAMTIVAPSASSTGAVEAQSKTQDVTESKSESGKTLPKDDELKAAEMSNDVTKIDEAKANDKQQAEAELREQVAAVNEYVQSVQRDLEFSLDKEADRTVIKVVDSGSGELIRQIPEDVFLELARNLKSDGQLQLVSSFG